MWHQLQRQYAGRLTNWIATNGMKWRYLDRVSRTLVNYMSSHISSEDDARRVWNAVPLTRQCCDKLSIFEDPMVVCGYALNHFLDRYWRTLVTLHELVDKHLLPCGRHGVNVLDVGAGPAPASYAIQDFYS